MAYINLLVAPELGREFFRIVGLIDRARAAENVAHGYSAVTDRQWRPSRRESGMARHIAHTDRIHSRLPAPSGEMGKGPSGKLVSYTLIVSPAEASYGR